MELKVQELYELLLVLQENPLHGVESPTPKVGPEVGVTWNPLHGVER